jgi:hypothetical protein
MSQPLYLIVACRNCKTHRPGTEIIFTGPRSSVPRGWRVICRAHWIGPQSGLSY